MSTDSKEILYRRTLKGENAMKTSAAATGAGDPIVYGDLQTTMDNRVFRVLRMMGDQATSRRVMFDSLMEAAAACDPTNSRTHRYTALPISDVIDCALREQWMAVCHV
jgi:hypothetical protein